jgi:hypothetical protein
VGLAILAGLIWYFGFLPADEENFRYSSALVVALGAGLWLSQFLGILRRPRRRETLRLALSTMLYAFGGYLVAVWLCLGLVLLAALPGLRNFDTQFQRTLREGEMPVYRSLAGL